MQNVDWSYTGRCQRQFVLLVCRECWMLKGKVIGNQICKSFPSGTDSHLGKLEQILWHRAGAGEILKSKFLQHYHLCEIFMRAQQFLETRPRGVITIIKDKRPRASIQLFASRQNEGRCLLEEDNEEEEEEENNSNSIKSATGVLILSFLSLMIFC